MTRRQWTMEEKRAAVARLEAGEKAKDIITELHIGNAMLYKWRKELRSSRPRKGEEKRKAKAEFVPLHEVTALLKQAQRALSAGLVSGKVKALDRAHLLMLLALSTLEGE